MLPWATMRLRALGFAIVLLAFGCENKKRPKAAVKPQGSAREAPHAPRDHVAYSGQPLWLDASRVLVSHPRGGVVLVAPSFEGSTRDFPGQPQTADVSGRYVAVAGKQLAVYSLEDNRTTVLSDTPAAGVFAAVGFVGEDSEHLAYIERFDREGSRFSVVAWRTGALQFERLFAGDPNVQPVSVSPDQRWAVFQARLGADRFAWDDTNGTLIDLPLEPHQRFMMGLAFSTQHLAAVGRDGHIDIYGTRSWSRSGGGIRAREGDPADWHYAPRAFIGPDRVWVLGDTHITVGDLRTGQMLEPLVFPGLEEAGTDRRKRWRKVLRRFGSSVSRDGSTLVVLPAGEQELQRVRLDGDGLRLDALAPIPAGELRAFSVSPDGRWLALVGSWGLAVLDLGDRRFVAVPAPQAAPAPPEPVAVRVQRSETTGCGDAESCRASAEQDLALGLSSRALVAAERACALDDLPACRIQARLLADQEPTQVEAALDLYRRICAISDDTNDCIDRPKAISRKLPALRPTRRLAVDSDRWCLAENLSALKGSLKSSCVYRAGTLAGLRVDAVDPATASALGISEGSVIVNHEGRFPNYRFCAPEVFVRNLEKRCGGRMQVSISVFDPESGEERTYARR